MRISATLKRDYSNQQLVPKHVFKYSGSMHPTNEENARKNLGTNC